MADPSLTALAESDDDPDPIAVAMPDAADFPTHALLNAPEMPDPLDLIDAKESVAENLNRLLEADALLNASALAILSQRLINMAQASDDIEEVRKAMTTIRDGAMLHEKRKTSVAAQAPLTIVFERGTTEGVAIDVRRGSERAKLRAAAASAVDATPA